MRTTKDFYKPGPVKEWDQLNENLSIHMLNGTMEDGPYTALLHSSPREKEKMPAQYHSADEELFVLGGSFGFDPGRWFTPGAYAYFPADFIHGTDVDIRGGYCVYLRIGGAADIFWEDNPTGPGPYLRPGASSDLSPIQLSRVRLRPSDPQQAGAPLCRALKQNPVLNDYTTMVTFEQNHSDKAFQLRASEHIEVFVLSGRFELGRAKARKGFYGARMAARPQVSLRCSGPGRLLVSHGGTLGIDPKL